MVWEQIKERLKRGSIHMTLIDPEKEDRESASSKAKLAEEYGSSAIMLGGSTSSDVDKLNIIASGIKIKCSLPLILFPNSSLSITKHADAIYFMSLLNSSSRDFLIKHQMLAAPIIKKLKLETIGMGYIVIEPGMKVGEVGKAELIKSNDADTAVNYSLAAEFFGMKAIYLEAGSGSPQTVPPEMIKKVKENISTPLIVGGGIRSVDAARRVIEAGADVIVTGTLLEESEKDFELKKIISLTRG